MARKRKTINLPAPYLKRIWLDPSRIADRKAYPFCLPLLNDDFELRFDRAITFIVFDEPESALSPNRQLEFLKLLRRMDESGHCQVIMATHAPMLMAYPNATLLRMTKDGLEPVTVRQTDHLRVMRGFCDDPKGFVEAMFEEQQTVGWVERSETHQLQWEERWVSLRSTHPTWTGQGKPRRRVDGQNYLFEDRRS